MTQIGRRISVRLSPWRRQLAGRFKLAAVVALPLVLTACLVANEEIISFDLAVEVPGLPGEYATEEGGTDIIAAVPFSSDYRFQSIDADGEISTGSIRAIPLRRSPLEGQV